jgi:hypothetical protein
MLFSFWLSHEAKVNEAAARARNSTFFMMGVVEKFGKSFFSEIRPELEKLPAGFGALYSAIEKVTRALKNIFQCPRIPYFLRNTMPIGTPLKSKCSRMRFSR